MTSGIEITNGELIFKAYPAKEIGFSRYCKSFKVGLTEIICIAIRPRLALDDEELFILIVNSKREIFPMPSCVIVSSEIGKFESEFNLKPIRSEWSKFEYEDHYGGHDKIIYPKNLYWEELFIDDYKLALRKLVGGFITKTFFGNMRTDMQTIKKS